MTDTVEELLAERIDGEIESVVWHNGSQGTYYGLVTALRPSNDTITITTVVLDLDDETLKIHHKNSMWIPAEGATLDAMIRSLARATNAASGAIDGDEPMLESLVEFDPEAIQGYELEDDYDPADGGKDWKETDGRAERYDVHDRLLESPIENADRLIRLEFSGKAPWEGEPQRVMYPPEEIGANYGVEVDEDDDLVILDVDDMAEAPLEEIPETLGCRSPHGGEHYYLHVPGWREEFRDRFGGVENPHPSYGEIRSQDGYVVGPACILTDCKHEECCTEDDPGVYELVDAPIATISAEALGDLIEPFRGDGS